jgi:hypothetical protein
MKRPSGNGNFLRGSPADLFYFAYLPGEQDLAHRLLNKSD